MRCFHKLPLRWRSIFRRQKADQDLNDELEFHLQHQMDEYIARGMTPEYARAAALRSLGAMEQIKEECRDMRHVNFIDDLFHDLRFGFRILRRNPGFSFLVILCLTLGIGANAAVFSWIEGVLFRPFPAVAHQERMVSMAATKPERYEKGEGALGYTDVSWPDFLDFQRNCKLVDWFIADRITGATLNIGERAEVAAGSVVSSNYFDALGIHPLLGRGFRPEEDWGRNGHPGWRGLCAVAHWRAPPARGKPPHAPPRARRPRAPAGPSSGLDAIAWPDPGGDRRMRQTPKLHDGSDSERKRL